MFFYSELIKTPHLASRSSTLNHQRVLFSVHVGERGNDLTVIAENLTLILTSGEKFRGI